MFNEYMIKEHLNDVTFYIAVNYWYVFLIIALLFFLLSVKIFKDKVVLKHHIERLNTFFEQLSTFNSLDKLEDFITANVKVFEANYLALYVKRGEIYILQARSVDEESYFPPRLYKKDIIEYLKQGSLHRYMILSSQEDSLMVLLSKNKIDLDQYRGFLKTLLALYDEIGHRQKEQGIAHVSGASQEMLASMMRLQYGTETFLRFMVSLLLKIDGLSGVKLINRTNPTKAKVFKQPEEGRYHKRFYIRNTPYIVDIYSQKPIDQETMTQVGAFLDLAGSYFEHASENSKMVQNYIQFLKLANQALEMQSPYFKNHSEKVRIAAIEIAKGLFLDEKSIDTVALGAKLHDIGMVGKIEAFLDSKKIDKQTLDLIHYHPIIGGILVEPISHVYNIAPIVRYHHERYDGTGYPYGLKGKDIPILAQIVALAEFYVGITSPRAYREALDHQRAVQVIEKEKNRLVEESVVLAFLEAAATIKKKIDLLDVK